MSANRKSVAFYHTGIGASVGGGGAGRFFIELFDAMYAKTLSERNLYFFTDPSSHKKFTNAEFFSTPIAKRRFLPLLQVNNRFKHLTEGLGFLFNIVKYRIGIVHICQYYRQDYVHRLNSLKWLPTALRPRSVVTFIHCNFPHEYFNEKHPHSKIFHDRFDTLFRNLKIDAVFSWYKLFCSFAEEHKLFKHEPLLYPIRHYCCNTDKFIPSPDKENIIVFAARLDTQKNPMMFLMAVNHLYCSEKDRIKDWKFLICGRGPLEKEVVDYIRCNSLTQILEFKNNISDMSTIFAKSRCFVSTQEYENFTSLSMNEAMAAGNAIISRNVGQTNYYVTNEINGYLLKKDTFEELSELLLKFVSLPLQIQEMFQENSIKVVKEKHSRENFINELSTFWDKLILKK